MNEEGDRRMEDLLFLLYEKYEIMKLDGHGFGILG